MLHGDHFIIDSPPLEKHKAVFPFAAMVKFKPGTDKRTELTWLCICITHTNLWQLSSLYAICIHHMSWQKSYEKSVAIKRASSRQWVLKPQDLAVALKLVTLRGQWLPYAALGEALRMSRFEAHAAVQRLMAAGLVAKTEGCPAPVLSALRAFVVYGAPYAYPAVRGELTTGFPTANGAAPLKHIMAPTHEPPPVWPHRGGTAEGPGLLPLYENLPLAAMDDPAFTNCWPCSMRCGPAGRRNVNWQERN